MPRRLLSLEERVQEALEIARVYGGVHGVRQKQWIIDQMVQRLAGNQYEAWVETYNTGEDGPDTYLWDGGISP